MTKTNMTKSIWNKILCFTIILIMALAFSVTPSFAVDDTDTTSGTVEEDDSKKEEDSKKKEEETKKQKEEAEKKQLQEELANTKAEMKDAKDKLTEDKKVQSDLAQKIKNLEAEIRKTEAELQQTEAEITDYNAQIETLQGLIDQQEADVETQNSDLNARLRMMYESGEKGNILEVLLGSDNIVDFLANLDMVKRIHTSDVELLNELDTKLKEMEENEQQLQKIKTMLEEHKQTQVNQKQELSAKNGELAVAKKEADAVVVKDSENLDRLEKESMNIQAQLAARQSTFEYGGGPLSWPVNGRITSEFGYRISPTSGRQQLHAGIDIAVPTGTPVCAAADGVVIFAGWNSGGYGNFVMIDNGGGIVTCYAHNSSVTVAPGQGVTRGTVIAKAGSTGDSTGPHCHFEVRVNGVPQNPRGWL